MMNNFEAYSTAASADECFEEAIDTKCLAKGEATVLIPDCFVEDYIIAVESVTECVK